MTSPLRYVRFDEYGEPYTPNEIELFGSSLPPAIGVYVTTPDDRAFRITEIRGAYTPAPWGDLYHVDDLEIDWLPQVGEPAAMETNNNGERSLIIIIVATIGEPFCTDSDGNKYHIDTLENPAKYKTS